MLTNDETMRPPGFALFKNYFHFIFLSILRTPSASNINILVFSSIWIFFDTNFDSNWLQCKFLMLIMKYNKYKTQNHFYQYLRKGNCEGKLYKLCTWLDQHTTPSPSKIPC